MLTIPLTLIAGLYLVRRKGIVWMTIAAILGFLGTMFVAVGGGGNLMLGYLTKPAAISAANASTILTYINDKPWRSLVMLPGFLLITPRRSSGDRSSRARTVPLRVPILFLVADAGLPAAETTRRLLVVSPA
jgi:hypothetical protein